jgi:hypothetical protein
MRPGYGAQEQMQADVRYEDCDHQPNMVVLETHADWAMLGTPTELRREGSTFPQTWKLLAGPVTKTLKSTE